MSPAAIMVTAAAPVSVEAGGPAGVAGEIVACSGSTLAVDGISGGGEAGAARPTQPADIAARRTAVVTSRPAGRASPRPRDGTPPRAVIRPSATASSAWPPGLASRRRAIHDSSTLSVPVLELDQRPLPRQQVVHLVERHALRVHEVRSEHGRRPTPTLGTVDEHDTALVDPGCDPVHGVGEDVFVGDRHVRDTVLAVRDVVAVEERRIRIGARHACPRRR